MYNEMEAQARQTLASENVAPENIQIERYADMRYLGQEHTVKVPMPNGALTSLAGNVDAHHQVAVADLILVQDRVRETVERLVQEHQPHVLGLSVMTFQRRTALRIIELVQKNKHIKLAGNDKLRIEKSLVEVRDRAQMVRDVLKSLGQPQVTEPA